MAICDDDHQTHKQLIIGGEVSSCVGTNDDDDPKIHGSVYIENGLNILLPICSISCSIFSGIKNLKFSFPIPKYILLNSCHFTDFAN